MDLAVHLLDGSDAKEILPCQKEILLDNTRFTLRFCVFLVF